MMDTPPAKHKLNITLIGAGTIGISLAALHLEHMHSPSQLTFVDIRPNLHTYIGTTLSQYLHPSLHQLISRINSTGSVAEAVKSSDVVHDCGPEKLDFKATLWREVEKHAPSHTLFWTATSGIPASKQNVHLHDKSRLVVVHPFNPPHILPLLEIVPSPDTSADVVKQTLDFWKRQMGQEPVVLSREITGFVAGRLAWVLLREAIYLVNEGVASVEQVDAALQNSMGARWAYAGPFKSFHTGGGEGGLSGLLENVGGTIQACWDDAGDVRFADGTGWEERICEEVERTYGVVDLGERDEANRAVLKAVKDARRQRDGFEA